MNIDLSNPAVLFIACLIFIVWGWLNQYVESKDGETHWESPHLILWFVLLVVAVLSIVAMVVKTLQPA